MSWYNEDSLGDLVGISNENETKVKEETNGVDFDSWFNNFEPEDQSWLNDNVANVDQAFRSDAAPSSSSSEANPSASSIRELQYSSHVMLQQRQLAKRTLELLGSKMPIDKFQHERAKEEKRQQKTVKDWWKNAQNLVRKKKVVPRRKSNNAAQSFSGKAVDARVLWGVSQLPEDVMQKSNIDLLVKSTMRVPGSSIERPFDWKPKPESSRPEAEMESKEDLASSPTLSHQPSQLEQLQLEQLQLEQQQEEQKQHQGQEQRKSITLSIPSQPAEKKIGGVKRRSTFEDDSLSPKQGDSADSGVKYMDEKSNVDNTPNKPLVVRLLRDANVAPKASTSEKQTERIFVRRGMFFV